MVYGGTGDAAGYIYAWDRTNGNFKWKTLVGGAVSTPIVVNNVIYSASNSGNISALDATTGIVKWKYQTGRAIVQSSPLVVTKSGKVYHPNNSGVQK